MMDYAFGIIDERFAALREEGYKVQREVGSRDGKLENLKQEVGELRRKVVVGVPEKLGGEEQENGDTGKV